MSNSPFPTMFSTQSINCNEQFLLFQQCFHFNQIIVSPFTHIFDVISLFAAELEEVKIGISGKGLIGNCQYTIILGTGWSCGKVLWCTTAELQLNPLPDDKI